MLWLKQMLKLELNQACAPAVLLFAATLILSCGSNDAGGQTDDSIQDCGFDVETNDIETYDLGMLDLADTYFEVNDLGLYDANESQTGTDPTSDVAQDIENSDTVQDAETEPGDEDNGSESGQFEYSPHIAWTKHVDEPISFPTMSRDGRYVLAPRIHHPALVVDSDGNSYDIIPDAEDSWFTFAGFDGSAYDFFIVYTLDKDNAYFHGAITDVQGQILSKVDVTFASDIWWGWLSRNGAHAAVIIDLDIVKVYHQGAADWTKYKMPEQVDALVTADNGLVVAIGPSIHVITSQGEMWDFYLGGCADRVVSPSPDGSRILVMTCDSTILFDETGQQVAQLPYVAEQPHPFGVVGPFVSDGGEYVIGYDESGTPTLFDGTLSVIRHLQGQPFEIRGDKILLYDDQIHSYRLIVEDVEGNVLWEYSDNTLFPNDSTTSMSEDGLVVSWMSDQTVVYLTARP